jgi:flagellar M-ring protein FliF
MVSSQKSEDDNQRSGTAAGGIPGTQSNLSKPAPGGASASGASHRIENVTYQSSRVIRHTRIPQGVIRRMSLSVLVGQDTRWEGDGKNRHRVYIPPAPETLQKIKDLVGGVTGFSADRGDQLIVETLPFESGPDSDLGRPGMTAPKQGAPEPQWMQVLERYKNQVIAVLVGLALLSIALRIIGVSRRNAKVPKVEIAGELEAAVVSGTVTSNAQDVKAVQSSPDALVLTEEVKALLAGGQEEATERIRQLAQKDMMATANVLRMWMEQKPEIQGSRSI